MISKLVTFVVCFVYLLDAAPTGELVTNLPGLNFVPNFLHYSGYLQPAATRYYHYWFTRHQYANANSPVILWLNGGPGCSSVGGLIEECGPFHVKDDGQTVYENVWAWNKVGHLLFLESPAGVGFSYETNGDENTNDNQTAQDNYNCLVQFFQQKFPELKNNDFYIAGESYAGVYIPTLATLLVQDKANFPNFKGIAIGNGCYNEKLNFNTLPDFFYNHGVVLQSLYDQAITDCCNGNPYMCNWYNMTGYCLGLANMLWDSNRYLDPYNLYNVCYYGTPNGTTNGTAKGTSKKRFIRNRIFQSIMNNQNTHTINDISVPNCNEDANMAIYLNRADVWSSLHIPENFPGWYDCVNIGYTQIYHDMSYHFHTLLQAKIRILVFNGDVDSVCGVMMNQRFVAQLNLTPETNSLKQVPWWYNGSYWNDYADISNDGGFITRYAEGLDFVTIRGSGHFASEDKPREALQLIYNFINNLNYSVPVPFSTAPQPLINSNYF